MVDRHPARVLAMQALCQLEVLREDFLVQLDEFLADEGPPAGVQDYARNLVRTAWEEIVDIDRRIQEVSEHWSVARMSPVDRNVLRVGVCELLHCLEVPRKVVIDEAVEIGKRFGTAESGAFINGVLDAVHKRLNGNAITRPSDDDGLKATSV